MKWPQHKEFDIKERTILLGYVGSIAHGTSIFPKEGGLDDKDLMGVLIPPKEYYFGLRRKDISGIFGEKYEPFEQWTGYIDEYDITIYTIRKFVRLLLKSNPNVLSLLWLSPNHYVSVTEAGRVLLDNRNIFSSKLIYQSFVGYAYGQLKRMTHFEFFGYMGKKRKELVDKFGFDLKNGAHLIRILRMGIEFLISGELNVQRYDAAQLIDIKQGKYSLEKIKEMAEDLFKKAEEAYLKSTLPNKPNCAKAEKMLIDIVSSRMN